LRRLLRVFPSVSKLLVLSALLGLFSISAAAHTVTLNWGPGSTSTGTVNYQVFRGTSSNGELTTPIATAVAANCDNVNTVCTFKDSNVVAGQTYFYYVETFDGTNLSIPSNEISVIVPVAPVVGLGVTSSN
jgi:hypothetical protein